MIEGTTVAKQRILKTDVLKLQVKKRVTLLRKLKNQLNEFKNMKREIYFLLLWCILLLGASETLFAQDKAGARYQKGKMIEISDLLSSEEMEGCESRRFVGLISAVQLKSGEKIESFTLKAKKGTVKIYLSPVLYSERLNAKDAKNLPTLIAKGKTITVDTYICGASGKIILALYILAGSEPEMLG